MTRTPSFATGVSTGLYALGASLVTLPAATAMADCKPVIAAYAKADATKRFAIYEVDSLDQVPQGEPMFITIGDVKYSENLVKKGSMNYAKDGYTKGGAAAGFEANSLRTDEQKGKMKCTPLPDRKFGGEAAAGYHVGSTDSGPYGLDPGAYDFWVSRATGLPIVLTPDPESGGFRYVFGNQVVAPAPGKIRN
ncbi:MAG: hypothetical protein KA763_15135 [Xanthomonadales bacterium]|nr:hypothetical protein [Xanthomonadales bacterium]